MATNNQQIQTAQEKSRFIEKMLNDQKGRLQEMLGDEKAAARALRVYHTACTRMPKLLSCTPRSLLNCFVSAAEFQLDVNTPAQFAYIIPYKDEATFQLGYRGVMELAYRSGVVADIQPRAVRENDNFSIKYGLHPDLIHEPLMKGDRGKVIGYYAVVTYITGESKFEYWTVEDCKDHADQFSRNYQYAERGYNGSPGKKDSTWHTNFDAMAMKTVIIAALKYAPKSIDDQRSLMLAPMRKAVALDTANDRGIAPSELGVVQLIEDDSPEDSSSGSAAMEKFVNERKTVESVQESEAGDDEPPFDDGGHNETEAVDSDGVVKMTRASLIAAIEETRKDMGIKGRHWGVFLSDAGSKDATLDGLSDDQLDVLLTKLEEQQAQGAK